MIWIALACFCVFAGGVAARAETESPPPSQDVGPSAPPPPHPALPAVVSPSTLSDPAMPVKTAIERGRAALEDELYPLAEKQFQSALTQAYGEGERTSSAVWLARSLIAQHRADEAIAVLRPMTNVTDAVSADVTYWLARAYYEKGDDVEALRTLDRDGAAMAADRMAMRARILTRLGRIPEALSVFADYETRHPTSPELPSLMVEWADVLWRNHRAVEAVGVLKRTHDRFPRHTWAVAADLLLAQIQLSLKKWNEAEPLLATLANDDALATSDRAQALLILAACYERQGHPLESMKALDRGLELARATRWAAQINLSKARLLMASGSWEEGRRLLREVAGQDPKDPRVAETQLFLAWYLLDKKMSDKAESEFRYYLETFEKPAGLGDAYRGRGWALLALDRPAEAALAFEQAAGVLTDPAAIRCARAKAGDSHFAAGAYEKALPWYDRVAAEPASEEAPAASYQAAECLRLMNRLNEAERRFSETAQRWSAHPLAGNAALRCALIHEQQQDWEGALRVYGAVLDRARDPELKVRAILGRGLLRYRAGELDAACKDFDEIVSGTVKGEFVEQAFFLRGWCAYVQGRSDEAVKICRDFIERYPDSVFRADVHFWLAELAYNRGEFANAGASFARLAQEHPTHRLAADALYWAGRSAMSAREYVRALDYFSALAKKYPNSPRQMDARFAQGDALCELGKFPEAILVFDEVIKAAPDSYLADLAWGRKGDCHFTVASEDPKRYEQALLCYKTVRDQPRAAVDLHMQAEYKMGRCVDALGRGDEAIELYMNVVYAHLQERQRGHPGAALWFARAGFGAAALYERKERWREAVNVYRRLVEEGGAASPEADERMQKIRLEKWMWF